MKNLNRILISTALLVLPLSALADNDGHRGHGRHDHHFRHHDQHGHRPHHFRHDHHAYNHRHHGYHDHYVRQERVYVPAVVQAPPVVYPYPQGVTIHGNVHVPF